MGLQLPGHRVRSRHGRALALTLLSAGGVLTLAGCSTDSVAARLGMPDPATVEGESTLELWQGAWVAALVVGVVVWGLIFYAVWRFRRRSDDEVPVQTRYNLPLEIFYTIFPVIMVLVFFSHTVRVQNVLFDDAVPEHEIVVVGQQWSWTFNHPDAVAGQNVYEVGAGNRIPTLVLPVDQTTRFTLHSPDVIHDFFVPAFVTKMDVIPGQENYLQLTPKTEGDYVGKCFEFCGVSHSRMLFNVSVVSEAEYEAYLLDQAEAGFVSEEPILGGAYADTQVGLESETEQEATP